MDSCFYYRNTEARDPRHYGLSVYEELKSEKGVQVLIADRRVAHVLWGHKQIMCERIRFLISGRYLPDGSEYLYEGMQEIGRMVFDLKNILLNIYRSQMVGLITQTDILMFMWEMMRQAMR